MDENNEELKKQQEDVLKEVKKEMDSKKEEKMEGKDNSKNEGAIIKIANVIKLLLCLSYLFFGYRTINRELYDWINLFLSKPPFNEILIPGLLIFSYLYAIIVSIKTIDNLTKNTFNKCDCIFEVLFNIILAVAVIGYSLYMFYDSIVYSEIILALLILLLIIIVVIFSFKRFKKYKEAKKSSGFNNAFLKSVITSIPLMTLTMIAVGYNYYMAYLAPHYYSTMDAKPIIYIYPEKEIDLELTMNNPELLTTTYPNYFTNNGWYVKAEPNGDLEDLYTGKKLYSLYWEGLNPKLDKDLSTGFVVKGEEVADFLDEKLEILGLNYKEREEFIVYWLPKLEKNKYNFIRFALTDECNEYMPLDIKEIGEDGEMKTADVDTLIRILMVFKPLNREIEVEEQILPVQERVGFTVVEWGGSEI